MLYLDKEHVMKYELDLNTIFSKQSKVIRKHICFEVLFWNFLGFSIMGLYTDVQWTTMNTNNGEQDI